MAAVTDFFRRAIKALLALMLTGTLCWLLIAWAYGYIAEFPGEALTALGPIVIVVIKDYFNTE